ncbi:MULTISPECIES: hypothetical protein [Pseudomonas]|uniref:Uncharacterized protein n=1 Tax=Pseudomonas fluorescens (strain Q2-87) TaxID=1038922 RepID=J2Y4S0_PSEFQ|nr:MULTISPECIES: hypothetical protein [Pseudomonas]EJL01799.1 hypothetical protein PflQ2_4794 [Pseudomonas fluorescens Q2-87]
MTVIVLINPENDPHLIADCLISADGPDKRQSLSVWIPSLGLIPTDWNDDGGPFHIARMGRKTYILPNNSGMLAFAGDCRSAYEFWVALSKSIDIKLGYQPDAMIDTNTIDQVLLGMSRTAGAFHILGVLLDGKGGKHAYIHRPEAMMTTQNFGTCYLAGSGTNHLKSQIETEDERFTSIEQWPWAHISPTEELAESLCSNMLYYESDIHNGRKPNTPIHDRFGGFYEWYSIKSAGIKPTPPRIDLNILVKDDALYLTRLHFSESTHPPLDDADFKGSQIILKVLTFCLKTEEFDPHRLFDKLAFTFEQVDGVLIERFFNHYDRDANSSLSDPRISGIVPADVLQQDFGHGLPVKRVRLTVSVNGYAVVKGVTESDESLAPARIHYANGQVSVAFSEKTAVLIADIVSRHLN